jgi:hypothetical protein
MKLPAFLARLFQSPSLKPGKGETVVRSHIRKKPGKPKLYVTTHRQLATELGKKFEVR